MTARTASPSTVARTWLERIEFYVEALDEHCTRCGRTAEA